jgi:hypothetical protein
MASQNNRSTPALTVRAIVLGLLGAAAVNGFTYFNDHIIRLTRDLHRWEAYFDFTQTATGNWSFRFEVALTDQQDLHFDYRQRSIQDSSGRRRF